MRTRMLQLWKQIKERGLGLMVLLILLFQQLPLQSHEVFNTGAFECTREKKLQTITWRTYGFMVVRKGQLWMGMNGGTIADLGFMVVRDRDETFLFRGNWDHYAEPTGIQDQIVDMD